VTAQLTAAEGDRVALLRVELAAPGAASKLRAAAAPVAVDVAKLLRAAALSGAAGGAITAVVFSRFREGAGLMRL